jgi:hypothetical protein
VPEPLLPGAFVARWSLVRGWILVLALTVAGCITPSIPIPPPDPDQMTFEIQAGGVATFSYSPDGAYEGATVYVFNRAKGVGVIDTARADGSVGPTLPFPAAVGDSVIVSFARNEQTVSSCIVLRQGRQSSADLCR